MTAFDAHVIVVGAGSAGCVLARRLSEDPALKVLLLEAGEEPSDPRIADPAAWPLLQGGPIDWQYLTIPQQHSAGREHPWPRGKVVGGSSAMHAMGHMRGEPADFDAWVEAGATGWGWQDLLPYFVRSETSPFADGMLYGGEGPLHLEQPRAPHPLTEAHQAAGLLLGLTPIRDHNGIGGMAGPTLNTLTIREGRRQSVADAYLTAEVRKRANLEIRTGVLVDRLDYTENRATGVLGRDGSGPVRLRAEGGVVLAAGSIATPLILMRSGLGPARDLTACGIAVRRDMPNVGANLQDHLLSAGNVYRARRPVPPTTTQHSESLTYIRSRRQNPAAPPELVVGCVTVPVVSEKLALEADVPAIGEGYTLMFGITHPRSRGSLRITSPDPSAAPVIDPRYLSAPEDRAHFVEALGWARALGAAAPYDAWRLDEVLPAQRHLSDDASVLDFIGKAAFTHHHPAGTCAMGKGHAAVVSPDLTIDGIDGLWICDASVFPSLTTGPVNAAVIAVAERGSEIISKVLA